MNSAVYTKDAKEFVVAYYTSLAYRPSDIPKYYDESAVIFRPSFHSSQNIHDSYDDLAIFLSVGSTIHIISLSILPHPEYLAIHVTGSITSMGNDSGFVQMFVLQEKFNRLYVTSDSFQYIESYRTDSNFTVKRSSSKDALNEYGNNNNSNNSSNNNNNNSNNNNNGNDYYQKRENWSNKGKYNNNNNANNSYNYRGKRGGKNGRGGFSRFHQNE